jgi:protein-tyrosine-phosphatase
LIQERRSSADARDVYCVLELDELAQRYQASGAQLHPMLGANGDGAALPTRTTPASVLFLCTHKSARSQMAEGLLRARMGSRPLTVASAGSQPDAVDPDAVRAMAALGVDITGQRSKHMDEFQGSDFDYVITVCDQVREECPVFPGEPDCLHWSVPDPKATPLMGQMTRSAVFWSTGQRLASRVDHLLLLLDQDATRS